MCREAISTIIQEIRSQGINHDVLSSISVIDGIAINETPLRIGKGRGELGEVDLPVIRDHRKMIFVPGSSLKGALRSFSEALSRGSGYNVCTPYNQGLCSFKAEFLNLMLQKAMISSSINDIVDQVLKEVDEIAYRRLEEGLRSKVKEDLVKLLNDVKNAHQDEKTNLMIDIVRRYSPCIICQLFGNQVLASKIMVFDMHPVDSAGVRTLIRTRIALDRLRDTARFGALFEYEYVPAGYKWRFRMELRNIDITGSTNNVRKLLIELLKYLYTSGIPIGGMKSVGHGVLKLIREETIAVVYRIKDFSISREEVKLQDLLR